MAASNYPADSRADGASEPGAVDNRLSLDPSDKRFAFAADWEDGARYTVTLVVDQISPGEFEVVSGSGEAQEGAPAEEAEGEEEAAPTTVRKSVKKMMDEEMA